MKARRTHFTGANRVNREGILKSRLPLFPPVHPHNQFCAASAAGLLHGDPIQLKWGRAEGTTGSCPWDLPAAEDAHKAEER